MHEQSRIVLIVGMAAALLLTVVEGPGAAHAAAVTQNSSDPQGVIYSAGFRRTYTLHVPPTFGHSDSQSALPLMLVLHGTSAQGADAARITGLDAIADREGVIVAYPDSLVLQGSFRWVIRPGEGYYDIAFIEALIDQLQVTYPVDKARIYVAGMSNGGYFTYVLGCQFAEKLAAIATVIGGMERTVAQRCEPAVPLPLLMITGTADHEVPISGDALTLPADDIRALWLKLDGCSTQHTSTPLADTYPDDAMTTLKSVWGDCRDGAQVIHYLITGGGHSWPGYQSPWSAVSCRRLKVCKT